MSKYHGTALSAAQAQRCSLTLWGSAMGLWLGNREGAGDSAGLTDASLLIFFCQLLCAPRHVQWIQHQPQRPLPSCAAASS